MAAKKWQFGDRIPANQLADITQAHDTGSVPSATLPLYHHAGTYDEAYVFLQELFLTLGINSEVKGGNFVIVMGPNKGINAYRG